MFRLIPNPTFVAAVPLSIPGEGKPMAVSFTFHHKSKTALAEWVGRADATPLGTLLGEVIAGWSGVEDAEGKPVPFSAAQLEALLDNYATAGREIFEAYIRELTESRTKN